jgi:hypothetical protein
LAAREVRAYKAPFAPGSPFVFIKDGGRTINDWALPIAAPMGSANSADNWGAPLLDKESREQAC